MTQIISLEQIKEDHMIRDALKGISVRIYSREYFMYWRPESQGYTPDGLEAGVWLFEEAWSLVRRCDVSKQIEFRVC